MTFAERFGDFERGARLGRVRGYSRTLRHGFRPLCDALKRLDMSGLSAGGSDQKSTEIDLMLGSVATLWETQKQLQEITFGEVGD